MWPGARLEDASVEALAVRVGLAVVQVARQHAMLERQADLDERCATAADHRVGRPMTDVLPWRQHTTCFNDTFWQLQACKQVG